MKFISYTLLYAMLIFSTTVMAQDAGPLPAAGELGVPLSEDKEADEETGFSLTGYVDAYYQANFMNSESEGEAPLTFPTSFTDVPNTFGIGNVNLLLEKSLGKVSFVGQIGFGPRAWQGNSDSNNELEADLGGFNASSTVQQLYVTYSPSDAVTFTLGNFGTFVGYEVIDASANVNYSTSYLFSNGPFYHTGAKVDFAIAEGFGAMIGVFNDTDSKFDVVEGKHLGAQLSAESGGLAAYLNFLYGKDAEGNNPGESDDDTNELQIDLTATYEVSESLMFGLNASNYASTIDGDATGDGFFGAALYSTIGVSDGFDLGLRAEYFGAIAEEGDDADQPSVLSLTASGNFTVGDLRIIPEVRFDSGSNGTVFGPSAEDESVAAFILAAVYSF